VRLKGAVGGKYRFVTSFAVSFCCFFFHLGWRRLETLRWVSLEFLSISSSVASLFDFFQVLYSCLFRLGVLVFGQSSRPWILFCFDVLPACLKMWNKAMKEQATKEDPYIAFEMHDLLVYVLGMPGPMTLMNGSQYQL